MTRERLSRDDILQRVEQAAGRAAVEIARNLFSLGDDVGAVAVARDASIAFRMKGRPGAKRADITLFVITDIATFYLRLLARWAEAGIDPAVSKQYEESLAQAIKRRKVEFHPWQHALAIPLVALAPHWKEVEALIRHAAAGIRSNSGGDTRS